MNSTANSTSKTIRFLRTLTADGVLTTEEVWALNRFFHEQPECRHGWPGDLLAPMLESAYDDGQLTREEVGVLAETITSIESEWCSRNPPESPELEYLGPVSAQPALLPRVDGRFEITSPRDDLSFTVMLGEHSCTCPDWQVRKPLPFRHPGKCCKHVAHAFVRTGKVFEPWFQALLDDCYMHGRGIEHAAQWLLVQIPESKPAVIGGSRASWCNVFAPAEDGYGKYAYSPEYSRWSYGESPHGSAVIVRAIQEHFPPATEPMGI